jgi:hypothetical protein
MSHRYREQAHSYIGFVVCFQPRSALPQKIFSPENLASTALTRPSVSSAQIPTKTFSKIYLARKILARYIHLALT